MISVEEMRKYLAEEYGMECTAGNGGFMVTVPSAETADLLGSYLLHFMMYDANGLRYRKLAGTLYVHAAPEGGSV